MKQDSRRRGASIPTIKRLPSYLNIVEKAEQNGIEYISARNIAEELDIDAIQVRTDIAVTGIVGRPRVGYAVDDLYTGLKRFLAWDSENAAILLGAGNLGSALMGHPAFIINGLRVVAAVDSDSRKWGRRIHDIPVYASSELADIVQNRKIRLAILTVPASEAQAVANELVAAGVRAIWNFTSIALKLPANIIVQQEDLFSGYAVLSVKLRSTASAQT